MAAQQPGNASIQVPGNDGSESKEVVQKGKRSLEAHDETDPDPEEELREGKRQRRDESFQKKVETDDSKTALVEEEDAKVVKKEMDDVEKQPKLDYEDPKVKKEPVEFDVQPNSRRMTEVFVEGQHLSIPELKKLIEEDDTLWAKIKMNSAWRTDSIKSKNEADKPRIWDFLNTTVPEYPTPVKFHVSNVAHVTEVSPLKTIMENNEFCPPEVSGNTHWEFSWWDLKISREEIEAELLDKVTTSPVFKLDESRYGNYRFTFPLRELMQLYKEQNCAGKEPVIRVFKTSFYLKEIVYAVLVHSPEDNERFQHLPYLDDSRLVRYQDGEMIWHAQNICEMFYVWDQVSVVFYEGPFRKYFRLLLHKHI